MAASAPRICRGRPSSRLISSKASSSTPRKRRERAQLPSRPLVMRPMRAVRLQQCNSLNRWVGSIDFPAFAAFNPETLLHDDQALCQMWISRSMDRTGIPFHQLCFRISHPRAGETRILSLGQFTGEFADTNAPLWLRRLTPERHYRFPLSRERAAQLIGGLTDIRVKDLWTRNVSPDMIFWAMKTAAGTPTYTELLYT